MMICSTVLPQLSPFNKKYVLSFKKNSVYLEKLFANTSSHSEKKIIIIIYMASFGNCLLDDSVKNSKVTISAGNVRLMRFKFGEEIGCVNYMMDYFVFLLQGFYLY